MSPEQFVKLIELLKEISEKLDWINNQLGCIEDETRKNRP